MFIIFTIYDITQGVSPFKPIQEILIYKIDAVPRLIR